MVSNGTPPPPKRGHLTFTLEVLTFKSNRIYAQLDARSRENQSGNAFIMINIAHTDKQPFTKMGSFPRKDTL